MHRTCFWRPLLRWQILHETLRFKLNTSIAVVQALICLHNFIITDELTQEEDNRPYLNGFEVRDENFGEVDVVEADNGGGNEEDVCPPFALRQRELLTDYFLSAAGAIP